MKIVLILTVIALASATLTARSGAEDEKLPKTAVQEFWTRETQGGRLTDSGWNQMTGLFSGQPSSAPKQRDVVVVADHFQVTSITVADDEAEVYVLCRMLGRLDASLQLARSQPSSSSAPVSPGSWHAIKYNLVRTDKYWEFGPDGATLKQVTGPTEWRLRDFQSALYLNTNTAVRYLLQMRSQATDFRVKKNAEMTVATLLRLNANPHAFAANPPQQQSQSPAPQH